MREDAGLSDSDLKRVVTLFYARVRKDPELGPIFNAAIDDWPGHLEKLTDFWSSIMLRSGRYKGNPLAEHMKHRDRITPELFGRWLALWAETTNETLPARTAAAMQEKAGRIAESLQLGLFYKFTGPHNRPA